MNHAYGVEDGDGAGDGADDGDKDTEGVVDSNGLLLDDEVEDSVVLAVVEAVSVGDEDVVMDGDNVPEIVPVNVSDAEVEVEIVNVGVADTVMPGEVGVAGDIDDVNVSDAVAESDGVTDVVAAIASVAVWLPVPDSVTLHVIDVELDGDPLKLVVTVVVNDCVEVAVLVGEKLGDAENEIDTA